MSSLYKCCFKGLLFTKILLIECWSVDEEQGWLIFFKSMNRLRSEIKQNTPKKSDTPILDKRFHFLHRITFCIEVQVAVFAPKINFEIFENLI